MFEPPPLFHKSSDMPRKTYRTYCLRSLVLRSEKKDGTPIEIVFRGGIQIDSTAKFSTSDKETQKFLEGLNGFGRDYYIEFVEEDKPVNVEETPAPVVEEKTAEPAPLTDVKDVKRFHNIVEMRAAMADLGFEGVQDMNYMQLKSAASKEGYDFQIQKN